MYFLFLEMTFHKSVSNVMCLLAYYFWLKKSLNNQYSKKTFWDKGP